MADPVLHLVVGPNGAGKSTLYEHIVKPATGLPVVSADLIAADLWPGGALAASYDAARLASDRRLQLIAARTSFATETVFSHPSKLDLLDAAHEADFLVHLHVVLVPVALSVARVASRVRNGGHDVPEDKVRSRYDRLWPLAAAAIAAADIAVVYDNSRAASPFRLVARFGGGRRAGRRTWPSWAPAALVEAGRDRGERG